MRGSLPRPRGAWRRSWVRPRPAATGNVRQRTGTASLSRACRTHSGNSTRAWGTNYDLRAGDRAAEAGQAAYGSLLAAAAGGAAGEGAAAAREQQSAEFGENRWAGDVGAAFAAGAGAQQLELDRSAGDEAGEGGGQPLALPWGGGAGAGGAGGGVLTVKRRNSRLDGLLFAKRAKKEAKAAAAAAKAAPKEKAAKAPPKQPGRPSRWVLRADAPAFLTEEEFRELSLGDLQSLLGDYYHEPQGKEGLSSKSGNRCAAADPSLI